MKNDWLSSRSSSQIDDIFEYQFLTNQETNVRIKETLWKGARRFEEKFPWILRKNKKETQESQQQNHTFSNNKLRFERRTVKHLVDSECDKGFTSYANLIEYGISLFAAARVKQQRVCVRSLYREATHIACSSWIHRKEI